MAAKIPEIVKLLTQLTVLVPATDSLAKTLGHVVERISNAPSTADRLGELERAAKLQSQLNESLATQLQVVQSILTGVQKSLKILSFAVVVIGFVSLLAIVFSVAKYIL